MRIAVVVSTYPPYKGGMGNVAAAHVEALRRAGHEVVVLAPGRGLTPIFSIGNAAYVPQLLWKLQGFDAVELHYPFFGGAEWVWLWKKIFAGRTRLAIMYHMDTVGRGWIGLVFRLYRALLLKPILHSADVILVSSRDYLETSQAAFLKSDPRVRETPFGVDTNFFKPVGEKKNAVLFVGGLDSAHYFKGVPILLEAFAHVAPNVPGAELWIVGDGDLRPSYEAQAAKLGLGARVRFLGHLDDVHLAETYRAASVHVLPSVDRSEAFGLVTLAAAASGIPSIVSDLPGVRTVIEPGVTGLLVKPADPEALARTLSELLSDVERTRTMGQAARERMLEKYAEPQVSRQIVAAICE